MQLVIAVCAGLASATAYGVSTAVEHSVAHAVGQQEQAGGVLGVVTNPRWLLGMLGDTLGLVLQIIALSTGPVVLIQPLLVLALPISLPVAKLLGGPVPTWRDLRSCAWIIVGLGAFFVLVGNPGDARPLAVRPTLVCLAIVTTLGVAAVVAARGRSGRIRAVVYGTVSGAWFGVVAVLLDAAAATWQHDGVAGFGHAVGLVPLLALLFLGGASLALTQVAFAVGALGASFPANLTADPVLAVILGAVILHERVPTTPVAFAVYVVCLGAVLFGAIRLAAEPGKPSTGAQEAAA